MTEFKREFFKTDPVLAANPERNLKHSILKIKPEAWAFKTPN